MKRSEKVILGVVVAGVLVTSAFLVYNGIAQQRRSAALATLDVPDSVKLYRDLSSPSQPQSSSAHERAARHIKTYQGLLERLDNEMETVPYRAYSEFEKVREDERPENFDELRLDAVRRLRPLIDAIREVAQNGGPVQLLDLSEGFDLDLSHLSKMRQFARLLSDDAAASVADGDLDRAIDDIVASFQLSEALAKEPTLASQLVRIAVDGIGQWAVANSLPTALSREHTQRLIDAMAAADHRQEFSNCFVGEGILCQASLDHLDELVEPHDNFLDYLLQNDPINLLYNSPLGAPLLAMDSADHLESIARLQDAAALPYYLARADMDAIERDVENLPRTRMVTRTVIPGLTRALTAQARHEALLDITMLGLSIERFQSEFGTYPERLDDVGYTLPGGTPVDPFTGAPYTYRVSDAGFLLYSVGENLVNDGGRHDYREGDIVWRGEDEE